MVDHSTMKLGKKPERLDYRTLRLARYLTPALSPAPQKCDWTKSVSSWPMMRNDLIGDCTFAAAGHLIQEWTANVGDPILPADEDIVAGYSALTGYNPSDPGTDQGAVELDVLNFWRQQGIAHHQIQAYVAVDVPNFENVRQAVFLFGGCYCGLGLPLSASVQEDWDTKSNPGSLSEVPNSWGGHAVPILAYDEDFLICVTWGQLKKISWDFWLKYCEEAYAVLSPDWIEANNLAPSGVDLETLSADLADITK